MNVYHAMEFESTSVRPHPWSVGDSDPAHRYHDFKLNPSLIPTVLEDFQEFSAYSAVQRFYSLLAWLNVESALESNDCAFRGPHPNTTDHQFPFSVKCSGRVMVLFKDIEENTQEPSINWLCKALQENLLAQEPTFTSGAVGFSRLPVAYKALAPRLGQAALGKEVMLSFWAYGDSDGGAMDALDTIISAIGSAFRSADAQINAGQVKALYT